MTELMREIYAKVNSLSEKKVAELLEAELTGPRRRYWLVRLHQRLTALRATRERKELLKGVK